MTDILDKALDANLKTVEAWVAATKRAADEIEKLRAENERLREALEYYTHGDGQHQYMAGCPACMEYERGLIAREALIECGVERHAHYSPEQHIHGVITGRK